MLEDNRSPSLRHFSFRRSQHGQKSVGSPPTVETIQPVRLTKPRTYTDTYLSLPKVGQSLTSPILDGRIVEEPEDILSPRSEADVYAFGEEDMPSSEPCKFDSKSAAILKNVAKKSSLSAIRSLIKDQYSHTSDASDIDIDTAVAILQEIKKKASPEDLIALHKALLPSRNLSGEMASPNSRETAESSISPLIRRRSLMPAGIATRSPSPLKQKLKNVRPKSEQITDLSPLDANKVASRHTSALGSIEHPMSRSYTPADLDVNHTGAYGLGTLRVTNGTVSPEPSIFSNTDERSNDDYFSADEGLATIETANSSSQAGLSVREKILRNAATRRSLDCASITSNQSSPRTAVIPGLECYADSSDDEDYTNGSNTPRQASDHADDYTKECKLSVGPYTHHQNLSAGSFVSRLSTVLDQDEGSAVSEKIEDPEDALTKLTAGSRGSYDSRPSSGDSRAPSLSHRLHDRSSMTLQSDSGYGSERSSNSRNKSFVQYSDEEEPLESVHRQLPQHADMQTTAYSGRPQTLMGSEMIYNSSETIIVADTAQQDLSSRPSLATKRHQSMPVAQTAPIIEVVQAVEERSSVVGQTNKLSVNSARSALTQRRRLTKPQPSPRKSSHSEKSPVSDFVQPVPMAWPDVPNELSVNFSRRMVKDPSMSHLDRTYASVAHTSQDNLSTPAKDPDTLTLEDAELWGRKDDPNNTPISDPTGAEGSIKKKKSFFRLSSKSFSRKSRSRSKSVHGYNIEAPHLTKKEGLRTVSDTIPSCMEVPTMEMTEEILQEAAVTPRKNCCPDSRPDSRHSPEGPTRRVGMDEETAREFARRKSRDIAMTPPEIMRDQSRSRARQITRNDENVGRPISRRPLSVHSARLVARPEIMEFDIPICVQKEITAPTRSMSLRDRKSESFAIAQEAPPLPAMPLDIGLLVEIAGPVIESPSHGASHPGWPGWESQAALWRERRKTLTETLTDSSSEHPEVMMRQQPSVPKTTAMSSSLLMPTTPGSDAKHTTPMSLENVYDAYRPSELDSRPSRSDVPRTGSAISASSFRTTTSGLNIPGSRPLAPMSANAQKYAMEPQYRAYRDVDAVSLAKLTSPMKEQRPSPRASLAPPTQSETCDRELASPSPDGHSLFDRYSGGLDYGWERGSGFAGSAGTRPKSSKLAARKSAALSESFGVDLSDVPVFLAKVPHA